MDCCYVSVLGSLSLCSPSYLTGKQHSVNFWGVGDGGPKLAVIIDQV